MMNANESRIAALAMSSKMLVAGWLVLPIALAAPTAAAADPSPDPPDPPASADDDEMPSLALEHLRRGAEAYERRDFARADLEFERAAHFAPDWPGLLFNRAAAAEGQGRLELAIEGYDAFMQHADEDQRHALELRVAELQRRRDAASRVVRRRLGVGWVLVGSGGALTAAAGTMIGLDVHRNRSSDQQASGVSTQRRGASGLSIGGIVAGVYGLMAAGYGSLIVARAYKERRRIRGLAWSPMGSPRMVGASLTGRF